MNDKNKHKEKVRIARKLQTVEEAQERGRGVFDSSGWEERKRDRAKKGGKNVKEKSGQKS